MNATRDQVLATVDLPGLIETLTGRSRRGPAFPCPSERHEQSGDTPPVSVTLDPRGYGVWRCHGCGAGGTAVDALIVAGRARDAADAFAQLGRDTPAVRPLRAVSSPVRPTADVLPDSTGVELWMRTLAAHPEIVSRLTARNHWTASALGALAIGWDGQRLTLPIHDHTGNLVNVCRYLPAGEPMMLALRGRPRDLFPAPELLRDQTVTLRDRTATPLIDREPVYLVEGEPDAITGVSLGLLAIAVPGSNGWRDTWAQRFAGMTVRVLADADEAGRQLSARAAFSIARYARDVRELDWPTVTGGPVPAGFDLTDWARGNAGTVDMRAAA